MRDLTPDRIVRLEPDAVVLLDQRRLPEEEIEMRCASASEVADAIRTLAIRGAPAIGVAAAYGLALAATRGEPRPADCRAAARRHPPQRTASTRSPICPRACKAWSPQTVINE